METRTIRSVLYSKTLDVLEKTELGQMARKSSAVLWSAVLTVALAYPESTAGTVAMVLSWENWILLKAAGSWIFCSNFRAIVSSLSEMLRESEKDDVGDPGTESVEGIPTVELVAHLFAEKRFSSSDAKDKFALPAARYSALAKKMEEVGILVRGDKNARVLNPDFSRSDVVSIFAGCAKAEDLQTLLRKDWESSYSHSPSMPELRKSWESEEPIADGEKQEENWE